MYIRNSESVLEDESKYTFFPEKKIFDSLPIGVWVHDNQKFSKKNFFG